MTSSYITLRKAVLVYLTYLREEALRQQDLFEQQPRRYQLRDSGQNYVIYEWIYGRAKYVAVGSHMRRVAPKPRRSILVLIGKRTGDIQDAKRREEPLDNIFVRVLTNAAICRIHRSHTIESLENVESERTDHDAYQAMPLRPDERTHAL